MARGKVLRKSAQAESAAEGGGASHHAIPCGPSEKQFFGGRPGAREVHGRGRGVV